MSMTAVIMMTVYLMVVWGLLIVASMHLAGTDDQETGTLGTKKLDDMPLFTK